MELVRSIPAVRNLIKQIKKQGLSIGFVPTMGALHEGHLSLINTSKNSNDFTVVSIFVNPIQFGKNEDFDKYPRMIESDMQKMQTISPDIVFAPDKSEIIGNNLLSFLDIEKLGDTLCGSKRPGHFRGVCTIVSKLFNIIEPDRAYFGKKDIQQYMILKKMAIDLNFDIEVIGCEIIREKDGLAMSSRNLYLSKEEREQALILNLSLKKASELYNKGIRDTNTIKEQVIAMIKTKPLTLIDYVSIVDKNMQEIDVINEGDIIALAVYLGKTRLIDNYIFGETINY